jgi:serine/threonine protein kinase
MYTLLFGKPPFEDNTVEQTYENIKTNTFKYPTPIPVSNSAKDLINHILVTNPAKRISLMNILDH